MLRDYLQQPNAPLTGPFTPSLSRPARRPDQNTQNTTTPAGQDEAPRFPWDAQADSFSLAAHQTGQAAPQISQQLCLHGYSASTGEVLDSLRRQGVQNVSSTPDVVPTLFWDTHADRFALSAHRSGQAVSHITARLCRIGYMITTADVVESLNRQGCNVVWVVGHDS